MSLVVVEHVGQAPHRRRLTVAGHDVDLAIAAVDRHAGPEPAAARALGNFKEGEASAALVQILKADKDVALRDVARSSLQKMTGHKAPAEAQVWEEYLAKDPASRESSWFRLASFWK